jgi:hypothetical protein
MRFFKPGQLLRKRQACESLKLQLLVLVPAAFPLIILSRT